MSELFGNDPFLRIVNEEVEKVLKTHENTDGIRAKADVLTDAYEKALLRYIDLVKNMNSETFDKFIDGRRVEISKLAKNNSNALLDTSPQNTDPDFKNSLALAMEPEDDFIDNVGKKIEKLGLDGNDYSRLFLVDFTSKLELFQMMIGYFVEIWPLLEIDAIVRKHFNSDFQWPLAVSLLATQENLVKKKLIDLKMTKPEIEQFLKQKGNNFAQLVELLAEKIQSDEKRTVNVSFFKSSALREVRNKIEHGGFDIKVTKDDVLGLLADLKKFEKELFPQ
ncbi:hypothetical protein [Nitrosopumilus sp.]|uniref:hypothetical protein n=1 Tax=Nitrosopumilus sp. TaxID=2024843 RepID=UPI0034A06885